MRSAFRRPPLGLVVLLAACKKDIPLPEHFSPVPGDAVGVYLGDGVGAGAAVLPVFATNAWGAAVPGDFTVTSAVAVDTTAADTSGWASVTLTGTEGAFPVLATLGSVQAEGVGYITVESVPDVEFPGIATDGATSGVAAVGEGVAWSAFNEVWWADVAGGPPVRVATLPDDVRGMDVVQADGDGVGDLLLWTDTGVAVLVGRSGGGLAWSGGWSAKEGRVAGANGGDMDGDAVMDVSILLDGDGTSAVSIFLGDGSGGYALDDVLEVEFDTWSISTEDLDEDGVREVSVLSTDSLLRRYSRQEKGWVVSGSYEYDVELLEGARLYPSADLTADGVADLIAVGPDRNSAGATYQAWVIEAADTATVYKMFVDGAGMGLPSSVTAAVAELSGDTVADLVLVTDLYVLTAFWNVEAESFTLFSYDSLPTGAPVSAAELTGDDLVDLAVGGDQVTVIPGQRVADDPGTTGDESVAWRIQTPAGKVTDFGLDLPAVVRDLDGDALVDLVLIANTGRDLQLQVYGGVAADTDSAEGFRSKGNVVLSTTGVAVDLEVCGLDVYATLDDSVGGYDLHHYRIGSTLAPTLANAAVEVLGPWIACGPVAGGDVAVVSADGIVYAVDGTFVQSTDDQGVPVFGAAGADPDGDGFRVPVTCTTEGCSVTSGDFDGDGQEDYAVAAGGEVRVTMGGDEYAIFGGGYISTADADGDGTDDLLLTDQSEVRVYRGVPGGLVPGRASFVWRPSLGPAGAGDLDGDGVPDIFLAGHDFNVGDSEEWDGTLIYTRGTPPG